ncbi:hypothetical protein ACWGDT_03780 [Streptomyces avermitilis]
MPREAAPFGPADGRARYRYGLGKVREPAEPDAPHEHLTVPLPGSRARPTTPARTS